MKQPDFDVAVAHRYFAPYCFNACWDLIEKKDRTADDDRMMVALSHASLFHWLSRTDVADKNIAVGYWQLSRVHALTGSYQEARRYADLCMAYTEGVAPFHRAYGHEAVARAALGRGDGGLAAAHLAEAWALAPLVKDDADRKLLESDLQSLGPRPG